MVSSSCQTCSKRNLLTIHLDAQQAPASNLHSCIFTGSGPSLSGHHHNTANVLCWVFHRVRKELTYSKHNVAEANYIWGGGVKKRAKTSTDIEGQYRCTRTTCECILDADQKPKACAVRLVCLLNPWPLCWQKSNRTKKATHGENLCVEPVLLCTDFASTVRRPSTPRSSLDTFSAASRFLAAATTSGVGGFPHPLGTAPSSRNLRTSARPIS